MNKLIILLLLILATGCTKFEPVSIDSLLTNKKWEIYDIRVVDTTNTQLAAGDDCNFDNTIAFKTDYSLIFDKGKIKCDSNEVRTIYDYWQLTADKQQLSFLGVTYELRQINASRMILALENYQVPGLGQVKCLLLYLKPCD